MPRVRKGMPVGAHASPKKQTTVYFPSGKVKVSVISKRYFGNHCGWKMKAVATDGTIIYDIFHNGWGFANPFSMDEAMLYAIKKCFVVLLYCSDTSEFSV